MVSINILPNEVLLEIFEFYLSEEYEASLDNENNELDPCKKKGTEAWQSLVHVCQRWRSIVFGSARGLELQLVCTPKTPARDKLDIWPSWPLCIRSHSLCRTESMDNIIAGLERSDRVCEIELFDIGCDLEKLLVAMQKPFPELIHLNISAGEGPAVSPLPDSFLDGDAPCLAYIELEDIQFPGLPNLLLSAPYLTSLFIKGISPYGYISPEVMVTVLSTLTCLEHLVLGFEDFRRLANQAPPPRPTSVLPVLSSFQFKGVSEYWADFVARIDAPQLRRLDTALYNATEFDSTQLVQFVCRTPLPKTLGEASVTVEEDTVSVILHQLPSLEQDSSLPLSTSEELNFYKVNYRADPEDEALWLELLQSFTSLKNLYLSEELTPWIVLVLQELVGSGTTGVLPTLENISLEGLEVSGPVQEAIGEFMAARQVTSHPIAVTRWERMQEACDCCKDDD